MEAFGTVVHRPMAVLSAGFTDSVCQRKSMTIQVSKKLAWSGGVSNSVFLDKGHLEYYNSDRSQKIGCRKVFAGSKTEKKMKKKDSESKENKKRLKMLKGLSRDLLMFSKTGFGSDLDGEVQPEMISDVVMNLQAQMQQLLIKENEQMLKNEAEQNRNLDSKMHSSCSSESSDNEASDNEASDVPLDSAIDMQQDPVALLQGRLKQLRIKEKEAKKKRKEERRERMKKLDCGMQSSSSSESSDGECEKLTNMNNLSCFLLPAEKQSASDLQDIVPQMSSMFGTTEVLEEDRVKDFGQGCCITEIVEYTIKPKSVEESTTKRVEVCMGGKCKKSGALLLMEEFQRQIGIEGGVSGCKCMGKCKSGPNVRVFKNENGLLASSPPTSVGLGDVGSIVANILGESDLPEAIKPPLVEV